MIILDQKLKVPLYAQIYERIREDIIAGVLLEGSRLPSYRKMAQELGVSKNTVEMAYQQLASEGYLISKPASGMFVTNMERQVLLAGPSKTSGNTDRIQDTHFDGGQRNESMEAAIRYDFRYGRLAPRDFSFSRLRGFILDCLRDEEKKLMSYRSGQGEFALRVQIQDYLSKFRGVRCDPEQIVVCAGTQYCVQIICDILKQHHRLTVAFEEPGYDGVRQVFANNKFTILPIDLETDGIDVTQLEHLSSGAVYVTPSHQFPLGSIMPITKRLQLLDWAQKHDGVIIEDDYDANLRYHGRPIPSLQGIGKYDNVVYLGNFAKNLSPSLRVSHAVLPLSWVNTYRDRFKLYSPPVPYLIQYALERFMKEGDWERHLRRVSASYRKKHDCLVQAVHDTMREEAVILGRNAGLHLVLKVSNGMNEAELIASAKAGGVKVYPVSPFWVRPDRYSNDMVLVGFSSLTTDQIQEGIRLLARAWVG